MKDNELQGNEKIEEAIAALQQEPTQEMLAHTLTVIRRRMQEKGQFVIAVEPPTGDNQLKLQAITTDDGKVWWMAFTSFEEELKGSNSVMSTFMTDIKQLFTSALRERVCQDDFCKFSKFKYLSAEKSPNISCLHIS